MLNVRTACYTARVESVVELLPNILQHICVTVSSAV